MTMREMQRPHLLVEEEKHISSNDHYENCNLVLAQKFLFLFDVLTALAAIRLIFVGYAALENYYIFDVFLGIKMAILPVIYMFDGFCAFLLTFLGCVGSYTQDPRTLVSYSLGILSCILLQIIGGFYSLYHRFFFKNTMRAALKASLLEYNSTIQNQLYTVWHDMQRKFECCGVDSPRDWMPYFSLSYVPVPLSCCAHYEEKLRRGEKCYARLNESSYQLGCYTQLQTVVADHFNWMLLSGVAPTLTEMTGLMLTLIVAKAIKTDMMLKKTRPWAR
ncbi:unnamed protein product [Bemisia tabaci]|uniref:Tetraspanin n=1 Tax=Bemisia tabaci TaxID=7038 RepID=A0A9P0F6W8_BEMTA|nr:unnamed protein product [Bemisia tabaci]